MNQSWRRSVVKTVLPICLIGLGVFIVWALAATASEPEQVAERERVVEVQVETVDQKDVQVAVHARGTVRPARRARLQPHVAGPVRWVSPQLVPGTRIDEGAPLVRINRTDYRLAVKARRGEVRQAAVSVTRARNRHRVSLEAWKSYERIYDDIPGRVIPEASEGQFKDADDTDNALALNLPQLEAAKESLDAARSRLEQARVNLRRTAIFAPFDAVVTSENVEVGDRASPQTVVATLVAVDRYWVEAAVPMTALPFIDIAQPPQQGGRRAGDRGPRGETVKVTYEEGPVRLERRGRVIRLLSEVDREGALARVLVAVDDPMGQPGELPLLIGSFVDVTIAGRRLEDTAVIPRIALRDDDSVWVMSDDERLEIRTIEVVRREPDRVLVGAGLSAGERVVTSNIPVPVEGLRLSTGNTASHESGEVSVGG